MAKTGTTKCSHSLRLSLWVLLSFLGTTLQADLHSFSWDFIVNASTPPGQLWIEVNCSVDGMIFLQFDNINKATPFGDLGKKIKATEVQKSLNHWLEILGWEFRNKTANMKWDKTETSGYSTLLATLLFQHNQGQTAGAFWIFNISGKSSFLLDTTTMTWKLYNGPRSIMDEWKDDVDLRKYLNKSIAEWSQKLNEFLKQHKEWPTLPRTTTDEDQPSSVAIKLNISVLCMIFPCFLLQFF